MKQTGIPEGSLYIADEVWPLIVRPLGFDSGIRTLERTIEGIARKVARQVVEGKTQSVKVTSANAKEYLPQQ
jgi:ATP-dependent Lon protease